MTDKTKTPTPAAQSAGAGPKKTYRTKGKAGNTAEVPGYLPVITNRKYQHAMSFVPNESAFLKHIPACDELKFENGRLHCGNTPATYSHVKEHNKDEHIEKIHVFLLMELYAVALEDFSSSPKRPPPGGRTLTVYFPDLAKRLGTNFGRGNREAFLKNIDGLRDVYGILDGGSRSEDILPALDFFEEDAEKNTFSFRSPYIDRLIWEIYEDSIWRDKNGNELLKKNGEPNTKPSYSYLVDFSMGHEKNRKAVEIALAVVALIEQAGNHTPSIKPKTLVEKCPALKLSIERKPRQASQLLNRAFTGAWALLREKTSLEKHYKNIELPEPGDKESIPTLSKLGNALSFPHKGKSKQADPGKQEES